MIQVLFVVFLIVWFGYWGYVLLNKPETFFAVWKKSDESMAKAGDVLKKAAVIGIKHLPKK
jgi:hypothetical protein